MRVEGDLVWWSPARRAVIPVRRFQRVAVAPARGPRLRDPGRHGVRGGDSRCADPRRPHGWIDADFIVAYTRLHELGWAHSVEAWDDEGLAGGLYGVATGGLFAAESMFSPAAAPRRRPCSGSSSAPRQAGGPRVLDAQWATPHLLSLGAVEITRAEYHGRLDAALGLPNAFT